MSLFDEAEGCLSEEQFRHFADEGVYRDTSGDRGCSVIVDSETVWIEGEESTSARDQVTLSFWLSELNPVRGNTVIVKGKTYELGQRVKTTDTEAVHLVSR